MEMPPRSVEGGVGAEPAEPAKPDPVRPGTARFINLSEANRGLRSYNPVGPVLSMTFDPTCVRDAVAKVDMVTAFPRSSSVLSAKEIVGLAESPESPSCCPQAFWAEADAR